MVIGRPITTSETTGEGTAQSEVVRWLLRVLRVLAVWLPLWLVREVCMEAEEEEATPEGGIEAEGKEEVSLDTTVKVENPEE